MTVPPRETELLVPGPRVRIAVPDQDAIAGTVRVVTRSDLRGHPDLPGGRPPAAVERGGEGQAFPFVGETGVQMRGEVAAVRAHPGHEGAARADLHPFDSATAIGDTDTENAEGPLPKEGAFRNEPDSGPDPESQLRQPGR